MIINNSIKWGQQRGPFSSCNWPWSKLASTSLFFQSVPFLEAPVASSCALPASQFHWLVRIPVSNGLSKISDSHIQIHIDTCVGVCVFIAKYSCLAFIILRLDVILWRRGSTLTLSMRDFKLLIFRWGHRLMFSSLHLFFKTVKPTFSSLAALVIGTSKYFWISSNCSAADLYRPLCKFTRLSSETDEEEDSLQLTAWEPSTLATLLLELASPTMFSSDDTLLTSHQPNSLQMSSKSLNSRYDIWLLFCGTGNWYWSQQRHWLKLSGNNMCCSHALQKIGSEKMVKCWRDLELLNNEKLWRET